MLALLILSFEGDSLEHYMNGLKQCNKEQIYVSSNIHKTYYQGDNQGQLLYLTRGYRYRHKVPDG